MTGVVFFNVAIEGTEIFLLGSKVFLRVAHDDKQQDEADEAGGNCCQRHAYIRNQHHDQTAQKQHNCRDECT